MVDPDDRKVYRYQPRPKWMVSAGLLLVAIAMLYAQPCPPFGLFLGAGSLIGSVMGILLVFWHRLRCPNTLVFTGDEAVIPRSSWSTELVTVPYASIDSLEREKDPRSAPLGAVEYLHILFPGGGVKINGNWLPSPEDLEQIEQLIRNKLNARTQ